MYYFLDVDGVLNKESDWRVPFSLNAECLGNFAELIRADREPHVILSSTWRAGYTNTGAKSGKGDGLSEKLSEYGITIEDSTPVSNKTRQEEIEFYIRRHNVSSYVILDDDESLFPRPKEINLFLTDYKTGLTKADVRKIIKKLFSKKFFPGSEIF